MDSLHVNRALTLSGMVISLTFHTTPEQTALLEIRQQPFSTLLALALPLLIFGWRSPAPARQSNSGAAWYLLAHLASCTLLLMLWRQ